MFNNDYENYMRTVLGYPVNDTYNYDNSSQVYNNNYNNYNNSYFPYRATNVNYNDQNRYEEFYPEIYKILKPMIKKICNVPNRANLSDDELKIMVDEIYINIEQDIDVINVNINTVQEAEQGKNYNNSRNSFKVSKSSTNKNENVKEETRQKCCANPTLKDLIKVMLIQELQPNNKPPRPPMPGPGANPNPGFNPRPPYRELENPDIYSNNYNLNQHPFYN